MQRKINGWQQQHAQEEQQHQEWVLEFVGEQQALLGDNSNRRPPAVMVRYFYHFLKSVGDFTEMEKIKGKTFTLTPML